VLLQQAERRQIVGQLVAAAMSGHGGVGASTHEVERPAVESLAMGVTPARGLELFVAANLPLVHDSASASALGLVASHDSAGCSTTASVSLFARVSLRFGRFGSTGESVAEEASLADAARNSAGSALASGVA